MDYLRINKHSWNARTEVHYRSEFYNVAGFLRGASTLNAIELQELGDVQGKKMLHLQCHFGLDSLSWVRQGAIVTGVDLSPIAIDYANKLKGQAGLSADFICSDLYQFGESVDTKYDIVFTSYGVLCWLPDVSRWAKTVSHCLRPGGTFYIVEFHPIFDLLSGYRYFYHEQADDEMDATYTENGSDLVTQSCTWAHSLGEIVSALIEQGIEIEFLNEHPYCPYNCFEDLEERQPGRFYSTLSRYDSPMLYSIKAKKRPC